MNMDIFGNLKRIKKLLKVKSKQSAVNANISESEEKADKTQSELIKKEDVSMQIPVSNKNVELEHQPTPVEKPFQCFDFESKDLFADIEEIAKRVERDPELLRECIEQLVEKFKNNYFISLYDEYIVDFEDGIRERPFVNFVQINFSEFKQGSVFKEAINEYIRIKGLIDVVIKKLDFDIDGWECYWFYPRQLKQYMDSWREDFTYFVISSKEAPYFISENDDELQKLCVDNNIHIVENGHANTFYDHTDNSSFVIKYYSAWGMVDDAATYLEYYIEKSEV